MTSKAALHGTPRDWAIDFAVATAAGAFLGVVGPYGSFFNGSLGVRLAYWIFGMWVGVVVFGLGVRLALHLGRRWGAPDWFSGAIAALLGSAVQAALVSRIAIALWPQLSRFTPLTWYGQCLAISIPLVCGYILLRPRLLRPFTAEPGARTPSDASGLETGEVLCLRMEDHYVRVHTAGGSRLVAGPFERVIAGMSREGMRVHRSWWVARQAVTGVVADGRNLRLTLTSGLTAPVSRASVARLRQAGWLDAAE